MKADIHLVLLDVGGPILNEDREYEAWDGKILELIRANGGEIPEEAYREELLRAIRRCDPNPRISVLWYFLAPDVARFREAVEEFKAFQARWIQERDRFVVRPGIEDVLEKLRGRYILALAGNQPPQVGRFLRGSGLLQGFCWALVSGEMGVHKPHPLFFRMILQGCGGIPPERAVMVGDRLDNDVFPAKLLGMRTVRLLVGPYRHQEPPTEYHVPDITLDDLRELPAALAELEGRP